MAQLKDLVVMGDSRTIGNVYNNAPKIAFGTCSTAAATAAKVVTVADPTWNLQTGNIVGIKFTNTNSASSVTLDVNGSGAKSIYYNNAAYTGSTGNVCGVANRTNYYMYDGTYWVWLNAGTNLDTDNNTYTSAYCDTGASTAAKKASCTYYTATAKSYLHINFRYANSSASALTLNVDSKGAYPIYINGTASSSTNYTLPAGPYICYFDGTNYYFRTDGKLTANITGDAATVSGGYTVAKNVPSDAKFTDTTYESKAAASGGTAVSLVTTGEKYTWNNKASSDTKNTAGTTNTTDKIYLAGGKSQDTNPQTYSNVNCYASGGKLYSNAKEVVTLSDSQALTNKTYNGYTLAGASAKAVDTSVAINSSSANLPTSAAVATLVSGSRPDGVFHLSAVSGTAAVTTSPYTSSKWYTTTNDARITALYSGLTISLKIPVAGNSTYGTLLDVNGLGNHPVVYNVNSNISTRYAVGGTIILTYNSTQTANGYDASTAAVSYTGCWQLEDYDYDSTNIYQLRDNSAPLTIDSSAGALYRYELIFMNKSGKGVSYNNTSNATTTYTKTLNSKSFDPFAPIYYYNSTTTVNAGSDAGASALYTHIAFDCRYSMNIKSDGTAGSTALTAKLPVYVVASYSEATGEATLVNNTSATSYLDRSSIVQAFPVSNLSGKILIYLGRAYSKYQIELSTRHPVYKWDEVAGTWKEFSGTAPQNVYVGSSAPSASNYQVWVDTTGVANNSAVINACYPVGAVYMSTSSTDPGTALGTGTWEAYTPNPYTGIYIWKRTA